MSADVHIYIYIMKIKRKIIKTAMTISPHIIKKNHLWSWPKYKREIETFFKENKEECFHDLIVAKNS